MLASTETANELNDLGLDYVRHQASLDLPQRGPLGSGNNTTAARVTSKHYNSYEVILAGSQIGILSICLA